MGISGAARFLALGGGHAATIVNEALALRAAQPQVSAADVLDLVMKGRDCALDDFLGYLVPPSSFALLVAEAVGNCMTAGEWIAFTGNNPNRASRRMWLRAYTESVLPKFVKRYG